MDPIRAYSPAKLNLRLKVTGRRENGYHELSMLNVRLSLCDVLSIHVTDTPGVSLQVSGSTAKGVPSDESNLVVKACVAYFEAVDEDLHLRISLQKEIPSGAGLGGGSSNAAAVLEVLQGLVKNPLTSEELLSLGASLGADLPFFLQDQAAWVGGIGEQVHGQSVAYLKDLPCLLITGLPECSTVAVYEDFRKRGDLVSDPVKNFPASYSDLLLLIENDLEESACAISPSVGELLRELRAVFGNRAGMTGSGSGVFLLPESEQGFTDEEQKRAFQMAERFGGKGQVERIQPSRP